MSRGGLIVSLAVLVVVGVAAASPHRVQPMAEEGGIGVCSPEYYRIDLVPTGRIPGTKIAVGRGDVTFAQSPFGIAVTDDGSYLYDLDISIDRLRPAPAGVYVAWVATPQLDRVQRLGTLDEDMHIHGRIAWNKFLVFITNEPDDRGPSDQWEGPVVLRGMSRSGMMHTMAGHGPYQREPCSSFGFR